MKLHPITLKLLKKGHPWVTSDSYSLKFPKQDIIQLFDPLSGKSLGNFIHDFKHPKIKARLWSHKKGDFNQLLKQKLSLALTKRAHLNRDNIYLVFGESDDLPGLFVLKLKNRLLIQFNAFFWEKKLHELCHFFKESFSDIWAQKRLFGQQKLPPYPLTSKKCPPLFTLQEDGLNFLIKFNQGHDIGLFSDMACIRKEIKPFFKGRKNILNLFAYTGAFTLMGLREGAKVTSVDLSKHYMEWLLKNIDLNQLSGVHQAQISPVEKAIIRLKREKAHMDLIICDPPSYSNNGKKSNNALAFYRENIHELLDILSPGGILILFLNTHKISREKFKSCLPQTRIQILKDLKLSQDCPTRPFFPEGNYLKGLILKKLT